MYSTSKLPKYVIFLPFIYKAIQWVPNHLFALRFTTFASSFTLGKLFLGKTPFKLVSFWYYFRVSNSVKDGGGIKNFDLL